MAKKSFEQSLKDLETIVAELENSDLPIEKALKHFEDGIKLFKYCSAKLDETEQKITALIQDAGGGEKETPFLETQD